MSFYNTLATLDNDALHRRLVLTTPADVERALSKERLDAQDYLSLLAPAAEAYLEPMAQRAHRLTVQHFGRTMQLFLPIYISDYCVNKCTYCSFSIDNKFPRRQLTMEEIAKEAEVVASRGIRQIIILTGESRVYASTAYLLQSIEVLKRYFDSIAIEVQPLDTPEYAALVSGGADGLTVYQETYQESIYREIHLKGPKRNFRYRLDAPERGCEAGMRAVSIGALLGLGDWRIESFTTGMHADYLQQRYPMTEIGLAFPRMRPHAGEFQPNVIVSDRQMVQAMLAARLFLPRAGITISTREKAEFRNHLIPLGVTKMSAASSTVVGGYASPQINQSQFEISDERSVAEIKSLLIGKGYQPVTKDWQVV